MGSSEGLIIVSKVLRSSVMLAGGEESVRAKPPASRALCQAKRAPRAAFPSGCLAAEHSLALPFFGIGMKADLFQSCGHWKFFFFFNLLAY